MESAWIRGVYTGASPRPVPMEEAQAWRKAGEIAARTQGAFVLAGSGSSMRPLYEPGTILVVRQLAFAKIQRGQTVLYRNQSGRVVAHVLVAPTRDGWRVQGLNNQIHDGEPVRATNLVGVVVAAFKPAPASVRLASLP